MTKIALIINVNEKNEDSPSPPLPPLPLVMSMSMSLAALLARFTLFRIPDHADDAVSCALSTIPGIIPDFTILALADNPLFTVVSLLGFVRFVNLNSGRDISVCICIYLLYNNYRYNKL